MSQLIESICLLNGEIRNLDLHQNRVNRSRYKLFGWEDELNLAEEIHLQLKKGNFQEGKFKCRILYSDKIHLVEIIPYQIKPIHSVRLVEHNSIEYSFKWESRAAFDLLKDSVTEDEIIIVKKGQITDTSYSNLVFFDGENWFTPVSCLLKGTMRKALISEGKIQEEEINPKDLNRFLSFKLINAMMNMEESPNLPISLIH